MTTTKLTLIASLSLMALASAPAHAGAQGAASAKASDLAGAAPAARAPLAKPAAAPLPGAAILAAAAVPKTPAAGAAAAGPAYSLPQLLDLAQSTNKGVAAAEANVDAASAAISSARAYPNPQVEVMYGRMSGKQPGVASGNAPSYAVVQKFDYPHQRSLREAMATRGLESSQALRQGFRADLAARVKTAYYDVLRRESELHAAEEDLAMMRQIHSRARLRVEVGEAPRYELIKAETELLASQKSQQTAELRVNQAKAALRQQVGGAMAGQFSLAGTLGQSPDMPPLQALRDTMIAGNAELVQRRMELERAQLGVDYQKSLRWPEVALRASTDRQPDNNVSQIGLILTIPLWDRRSGPVGEATAQATQARSALEMREFELTQELEAAYRQYEINQAQVTALESGIVREAESALGVAEAAYRFGERGILDYLDAQRVLRGARNELIAAQYDLQLAAIQIEKLMSTAPGATAAPGLQPTSNIEQK
ncbi:TolC family protein [Cupriavidus taiwanensis]|uniref:Outer membrane protein of the copper-transporting efflux system CusCFBA n=1 Tax=Cupriavidus taiwanensis TaxID=164546 RepID=A0A375CBW0_9BURK|nr:TolC family protein [Cupriavidus taiwanensis]MDK3021385.1 TolC family protein [Cupriavidus taiwanensis]SOY67584.1 Outer membrane protein of the copper-transporting efflux system CusCFBA [Cupriavidus taiwanensis]